MNYGCFTCPDPGQVKPAKDARRADEREIRDHAFPLTRRGGRRNCRASRLHATRTGPLSGNRLPCLPCRDAAAGVAASWPRPTRCWALLAGPATALPRTNAAARVTLAAVRIPPRD